MSFFGVVVILFVVLQVIAQAAVVPQVKLCNWENCPTVSRIGLGTLHLGDSISGISDPVKINEWINTGVSVGITLFDTADVRNFRKKFFSSNFLLTSFLLNLFRFTLLKVALPGIPLNFLAKLYS
jgi:hypothetical protein